MGATAIKAEQAFARRKVETNEPVDHIPEIKHVVLLMMENHSFDNYFGTLGPSKGGFDTANPPVNDGVKAWHRAETSQLHHVPTQSWRGSRIQYNGGACDGFVRSAKEMNAQASDIGMAYWTEQELPFYYSLARTFPLCTRWFSSCLGPTFPNRRFLLAGTANGLMDDVLVGMLDTPAKGTILDVLSAHNISWTNYHNVPSSKLLLTRVFGKLGVRVGRWLRLLAAGIPSLSKYVIGNMQFTANLYPTGLLRVWNHTANYKKFFDEAKNGTLPFLSIVDPDFNNWSEENKQDIQRGEGFAHAVIKAVMDGPGWANTVLVWFYDEHGGYFDTVPPPAAPEPDNVKGHCLLDLPKPVTAVLKLLLRKQWADLTRADGDPDRSYDRYGFRVPAVVVSPFAKPDCVSDTVFDHTSALKLINEKWGLEPRTQRDAQANSILELLDLANPGFPTGAPLADPAKPWSLNEAG